jgi:hypothetical protein
MSNNVWQRGTYYGKENGLVVCPCEQNSSIEMILHCGQKSQNEAYRHDRCKVGGEGSKADVHVEKDGECSKE